MTTKKNREERRAEEKLMRREGRTSRLFSYTKGVCKLEFTLRTDVKDELNDFLELMEAGVEDIKKEIEK